VTQRSQWKWHPHRLMRHGFCSEPSVSLPMEVQLSPTVHPCSPSSVCTFIQSCPSLPEQTRPHSQASLGHVPVSQGLLLCSQLLALLGVGSWASGTVLLKAHTDTNKKSVLVYARLAGPSRTTEQVNILPRSAFMQEGSFKKPCPKKAAGSGDPCCPSSPQVVPKRSE
jgi:hypothetical protein